MRSFQIEHHTAERGHRIVFSGRLSFAEATPLWHALREVLKRYKRRERLDLDMRGVTWLDGGAMALLAHFRAELYRRGGRAEFVGASDTVQEVIRIYRGDQPVQRRKRREPKSAIEQIGEAAYALSVEVQLTLAFLGQTLVGLWGTLKDPKSANWRDLAPTCERTGADAVPIVLLINFLVGLVMAFQASVQLKRFGANILVADLIGISITRELGPLMTAIVVCGRSGAAFAAELGSMKVNEEVDALRTMGLGTTRYLVFPRLLALMLVMPLLSILADLMGILGGLVVAITNLELTPVAYIHEVEKAVKVWDVISGLIKSVLFATAIAGIACQQGLATEGGAEGVGKRTTGAVVATLFTLIMIDALFTVFFRLVGR
ncbi:MAG TPA: MlaE family lipid ABC transporter permease subunit [Polyangiales bacterium]